MQAITIATALDEVINQQDLPLEAVIDRNFSPSYWQRTNGHWDDREGFAQHARKLREVCNFASIDVLDELRDGNLYATRHRVHGTKCSGSQSKSLRLAISASFGSQ